MSDPSIVSGEVAPTSTSGTPEAPQSAATGAERASSLFSDAWRELRRKPVFVVAAVLIAIYLLMAAVPGLFTSTSPTHAELARSFNPPSSKAWFGYDLQGRDLYARTIYGARASIVVGVCAVLGVTLIGGTIGIIAGYYGGIVDALLSRLGDVFFGLPFVLGAIVILSTFAPAGGSSPVKIIALVVTALVMLGWPQMARIMRSSVISAKDLDYVQAARALGAGPGRIIFRHVLPNAIAPVIVVATISLGAYIGAEATLSFLGIGLQSPVVSWGIMISDAAPYLRTAPAALLFPAVFLSIAVLSFVMLGDAIREALDPKLR